MKGPNPSEFVQVGGEVFGTSRTVVHPEDRLRELLDAAKHCVMEWRLHGQLTDSCRNLERAIENAEVKPLVSPGRPWEVDD